MKAHEIIRQSEPCTDDQRLMLLTLAIKAAGGRTISKGAAQFIHSSKDTLTHAVWDFLSQTETRVVWEKFYNEVFGIVLPRGFSPRLRANVYDSRTVSLYDAVNSLTLDRLIDVHKCSIGHEVEYTNAADWHRKLKDTPLNSSSYDYSFWIRMDGEDPKANGDFSLLRARKEFGGRMNSGLITFRQRLLLDLWLHWLGEQLPDSQVRTMCSGSSFSHDAVEYVPVTSRESGGKTLRISFYGSEAHKELTIQREVHY